MGQWLNVTSERNMVQLSHVLNPEAAQGSYRLFVTAERGERSHSFQVKKYVLPKFDVTLNAPEKLSVGAAEVRLQACAKYTFGQPVPGKASMSLCRGPNHNRYGGDEEEATVEVCLNEEVELDQSGCASHVFNMAGLTHPDLNEKLRDSLTFKAIVAEEGTGISCSETKDIQLDYALGKLTFVDTPDKIDDGAVMQGKVWEDAYKSGTCMVIVYTHDTWTVEHNAPVA
ncbi:hypothetical protein ACEWY4_001280 [Coilia grayii]|uniref:Macroglobulin domain-containing protein n=1 Tax=Coilia grayii TaxID=363190 RepID=A0ABD1KSG6_9TELE